MLVGANAEAKRFYEQAIDALSQLPETDETQRQLVDLALKLARVAAFNPTDNVLDALKKSLTAAESLGDETLRTQVIASTGAFHYMIGKLGEALGYFRQSIELAEKLSLEKLLVLPYNILGRSMMLSGDWPQAEAILPKGIKLLRESGQDPELLAGSLAFYGAVLMVQGKTAEGQRNNEESMQLARAIALPSRIAGNLMVIGFAHTLSGKFTEAYTYLYECLDIVKDTGDFHPTYMSHGCLGYASLQQDDVEAAKLHLDKAIEITRGGPLPYVPLFQSARAEVELRNENWNEALNRAQAALELAEKAMQQTSKAETLRVLGKIYIAAPEPDWAQAEACLQQSIDIHQQYNVQTLAAVSTLELGKLYIQMGESEKGRAAVQKARDRFMDLKMTWHFVQSRQLLGD
jgi:tetratricopeptide (TPR) repeat protein